MSKDVKSNWKTLSGEVAYDNPWIRTEHHKVITPTGIEGIYGKVHLKNLAIGIIPLDSENNTWLVGQYRYPLNMYSWEIPMGGGPLNRPIIESARRELQEETGLRAFHWQQILEIHTSNCVTDEHGFVFVAKELEEGDTSFDETEQLDIHKLPFAEAYQMVLQGKITDSLSVAGILKVQLQFFNK